MVAVSCPHDDGIELPVGKPLEDDGLHISLRYYPQTLDICCLRGGERQNILAVGNPPAPVTTRAIAGEIDDLIVGVAAEIGLTQWTSWQRRVTASLATAVLSAQVLGKVFCTGALTLPAARPWTSSES